MKKNYRWNIFFRKYIDKKLNLLAWDDKTRDILADILLRSAYQYKLNKADIDNDIKCLDYNLNKIDITDSTFCEDNDVIACYYPDNKEIKMQLSAVKDNIEQAYQILVREVYHVLLKDCNGVDRFRKENPYTKQRNNIFPEIFVEKMSYRTVFPTKTDLTKYNKNASWYTDFVFIIDMIEATYGVNEQNILKHARNGRFDLELFLSKSIGENIEDTIEFLDSIEVGASLLNNTIHKYLKRDYSDEEKLDFIDNIQSALESMFNICENKLIYRLEITDIRTVKDVVDLSNEISFCQNRLQNILNDRASHFDRYMESNSYILDECLKKGQLNINIIMEILNEFDLIVNEPLLSDDCKLNTIEALKNPYLAHDSIFKRYNNKEKKVKVSKKYIKNKEEKKSDYCEWNNSYIKKKILDWIKLFETADNSVNNSLYTLNDEEKAEYQKNYSRILREQNFQKNKDDINKNR